jgi:hypothetical protein
MIIIGFSLWYLIGLYSFYYWWTKDGDITADPEIITLWLIVGLAGVIAWFIGMSIHKDPQSKEPIVLFKKRKQTKN